MSDIIFRRQYEALPQKEQEYLRDIFEGRRLPSLHYDTVAKVIFDPDRHPDRAEFLLRSITGDKSIEVRTSARHEGVRFAESEKSVIFDIPVWLMDQRLTDLEFQKKKQNFIMKRGELYMSNMLMIQYSADQGRKKKSKTFNNTASAVLIVLLVESPNPFKDYNEKTDRYIHRFEKMEADTGLTYVPLAKTIYVQLDKCLEQYKKGVNAETEDGRPDELQLWLAAIADINDQYVREQTSRNNELKTIQTELFELSQDKEVQALITAEEFAKMDFESARSEAWEEGIEEGRKEGIEEGRKEGIEEGRKEGIEEGRKEGIEEGRANEIISSVAEGDYTIERGCRKLGMEKSDFLKLASDLGYHLG